MADSESISGCAGIYRVIMAFRDTDTGPQPSITPNQHENYRQRNGGLVLEELGFNWDAPHGYVELLNFQLDMMNILETRAYGINEEERIPVIKKGIGQEGLFLMKTFAQKEKGKCRTTKGLYSEDFSFCCVSMINLTPNYIISNMECNICIRHAFVMSPPTMLLRSQGKCYSYQCLPFWCQNMAGILAPLGRGGGGERHPGRIILVNKMCIFPLYSEGGPFGTGEEVRVSL